MFICSNHLREVIQGDVVTLLDTLHAVRLFTNDFQPIPSSVLADFTEATFDGYAAKAIANATGFRDPATGDLDVQGEVASEAYIAGAAIAGPQTVYGWYITLAILGTEWIAAGRLDEPITVAAENDGVVLPDLIGAIRAAPLS